MTKAQAEARAYIEQHRLDVLMKDMLNSLVHAKDPHPEVFMIKYLLTKAGISAEEIESTGLQLDGRELEESKEPTPHVKG